MGQKIRESIDSFLESIKQAGVRISNETELRERLVEARMWHMAFMTLVSNGKPLGISFEGEEDRVDETRLHTAFTRHEFSSAAEGTFTERLKLTH